MSGGAVADRFRPTLFVPFLKNKRHTWQLWFARSPTLWRSIPETTLLPANPEKKTAEHRFVVAGQNLTLAPATACARQSRYDNRASQKESQHVLDVPLLASPPVQGRRDRRQPIRAPQPRPCTGPQTCARYRRRRRIPPECRARRCRHDEAQSVALRRCARRDAAWDPVR